MNDLKLFWRHYLIIVLLAFDYAWLLTAMNLTEYPVFTKWAILFMSFVIYKIIKDVAAKVSIIEMKQKVDMASKIKG